MKAKVGRRQANMANRPHRNGKPRMLLHHRACQSSIRVNNQASLVDHRLPHLLVRDSNRLNRLHLAGLGHPLPLLLVDMGHRRLRARMASSNMVSSPDSLVTLHLQAGSVARLLLDNFSSPLSRTTTVKGRAERTRSPQVGSASLPALLTCC